MSGRPPDRRRVLTLLPLLCVTGLPMAVHGQDVPEGPPCRSERTLAEERPGQHLAFREGYRAFERRDYEEAARQMCEAEKHWPEDGELTRVGRPFIPYLPRYYLGAALHELGCYRTAIEYLDRSIVSYRDVDQARREREDLERRRADCALHLGRGEDHGPDAHCSLWQPQEEAP